MKNKRDDAHPGLWMLNLFALDTKIHDFGFFYHATVKFFFFLLATRMLSSLGIDSDVGGEVCVHVCVVFVHVCVQAG